MQPDGNLSMVTLASLLRGGANGAPIIAGEGAASLLVRKLKGRDIEGQPMPLGKPSLPPEVIATIETWIDQGVKLDLLTAQTALTTVAAAGRARMIPPRPTGRHFPVPPSGGGGGGSAGGVTPGRGPR